MLVKHHQRSNSADSSPEYRFFDSGQDTNTPLYYVQQVAIMSDRVSSEPARVRAETSV
jgi:hypothetical protein